MILKIQKQLGIDCEPWCSRSQICVYALLNGVAKCNLPGHLMLLMHDACV